MSDSLTTERQGFFNESVLGGRVYVSPGSLYWNRLISCNYEWHTNRDTVHFMKLGNLDVIQNLNCEFENDYNANMPGLLFTELKLWLQHLNLDYHSLQWCHQTCDFPSQRHAETLRGRLAVTPRRSRREWEGVMVVMVVGWWNAERLFPKWVKDSMSITAGRTW